MHSPLNHIVIDELQRDRLARAEHARVNRPAGPRRGLLARLGR